jgi:alpha-glucosidase
MFGKLVNYSVEANKIIVEFEKKKGIVTLLSEEIINLKEENTAKFSIDVDSFYSFDFFDTSLEDGKLNITSGMYRYVIKDNFMMDVYKNDVLISQEDYLEPIVKNEEVNLELMALEGHRVERFASANHIVINKRVNKDDYLYGLGEKTGFLNKRNYEYEMYNKQLISFVQLIEVLSDEIPIVSQKEYELKSNDSQLIEIIKKSLNQLESIQIAAENVLNKLSTMLVQFRTTNTTVVKYHNIIQKITTSLQ